MNSFTYVSKHFFNDLKYQTSVQKPEKYTNEIVYSVIFVDISYRFILLKSYIEYSKIWKYFKWWIWRFFFSREICGNYQTIHGESLTFRYILALGSCGRRKYFSFHYFFRLGHTGIWNSNCGIAFRNNLHHQNLTNKLLCKRTK